MKEGITLYETLLLLRNLEIDSIKTEVLLKHFFKLEEPTEELPEITEPTGEPQEPPPPPQQPTEKIYKTKKEAKKDLYRGEETIRHENGGWINI